MIIDINKILTESKIDEIQRQWKALTKLPVTNPRGYSDPNKHDPSIKEFEKREIRIRHLKQFIKLFYTDLIAEPPYYISGKDQSTRAFEKYIHSTAISQFPFFSIDYHHNPECFFDDDSEFNQWILNLFNAKSRVQWTPLKNPYPEIDKIKSDFEFNLLFKIRLKRLTLLAKICHFIDTIQVEDYINNEIKIKANGAFIGNVEGLVYGNKHALSAFLGHWIIRHFPFKDFRGFRSEKWKQGTPAIYEHFTPMSFFRDLIWIKNSVKDQDLIFDFESLSAKPYEVEEWLSFLWYRYRTILITAKEDGILTCKKEKSRRSAGNVAYEKAQIKIDPHLEHIWIELHSIDNLKLLFQPQK